MGAVTRLPAVSAVGDQQPFPAGITVQSWAHIIVSLPPRHIIHEGLTVFFDFGKDCPASGINTVSSPLLHI